MKSKSANIFLALLGAVLAICGIVTALVLKPDNNALLIAGYLLAGLGFGIFGHFFGFVIADNSPEKQALKKIETHDERNILLSDKAKAKAFTLMTYVFAALMIAFSFMKVDIVAIILFIAAYLVIQIYALCVRVNLEKKM